MKDWKTTLGGIGAIAGGIVLFLLGKTPETTATAITLIGVGGGLVAAKDKDSKKDSDEKEN